MASGLLGLLAAHPFRCLGLDFIRELDARLAWASMPVLPLEFSLRDACQAVFFPFFLSFLSFLSSLGDIVILSLFWLALGLGPVAPFHFISFHFHFFPSFLALFPTIVSRLGEIATLFCFSSITLQLLSQNHRSVPRVQNAPRHNRKPGLD